MVQLLVSDIDDGLVRLLEQRAASHGRSVEEEHRLILEEALLSAKDRFLAEAARLRQQTRGRTTTDSVDLIRADRNRDGAPW